TKGDPDALDKLTPRVYNELRRIAAHYMRAEPGVKTLHATDLVHETFLRLIEARGVELNERAHFYALCAQMMRRILVDRARKRRTAKRGGTPPVSLSEGLTISPTQDWRLLALDDALDQLNRLDPRKAKVVELRYFGGLSVAETATVLQLSKESVHRDWRM